MNLKSTANTLFLSEEIFSKRTETGLNWLIESFKATGNNGSAAYYSRLFRPLTGWHQGYPETTGYIIKTFWDYNAIYPEMELEELAKLATNWICTLQFKNGALPGGFANSNKSSVFNTGQMILGLNASFEKTKNDQYLITIKRAVEWLVSILEEDGSWKKSAYMDNWIPSYYTRVIWPVLWANKFLKDENVDRAMQKAINFYSNKITKKKSVKDWAFQKGKKAFTHTIAYTIRGFLESAILLNNQELLKETFELGEKILRLRELNTRMAGAYDEDWKGDYKYTCITGNAQLSIILSRMYQESNDIRYLNTSLKIFEDIVSRQKLGGGKNLRGAVPGSSPIWGRYLIFRYPNWATKFYLDAYLLLYQEINNLISEKVDGQT